MNKEEFKDKWLRHAEKPNGNASGNAVGGKHYWLTPPELREQIRAEFGPNIFDPCPFPRPEGFDGLRIEWGLVNYVNPLFRKGGVEGAPGISEWVKKIIIEQAKGKTSILVFPSFSWLHLLINAGAEMRSLGQVHWLATEDRTTQKSSLPIVMFVVRGKKKS